jgi:hypothetical protein
MHQILFSGFHVDDFKKLLGEVIDEKLKQLPVKEQSKEHTSFLSREEVAKMLKVSLPTLNEYSKNGIVQSYRVGNRVLYRLDEILESIKQVKNLKYKRG